MRIRRAVLFTCLARFPLLWARPLMADKFQPRILLGQIRRAFAMEYPPISFLTAASKPVTSVLGPSVGTSPTLAWRRLPSSTVACIQPTLER